MKGECFQSLKAIHLYIIYSNLKAFYCQQIERFNHRNKVHTHKNTQKTDLNNSFKMTAKTI